MSGALFSLKNGADAIIATGALFMVLTSITVGLRIVSRPLLKIKLGIEDYSLIAALIFFWVQTGLNFTGGSARTYDLLRIWLTLVNSHR